MKEKNSKSRLHESISDTINTTYILLHESLYIIRYKLLQNVFQYYISLCIYRYLRFNISCCKNLNQNNSSMDHRHGSRILVWRCKTRSLETEIPRDELRRGCNCPVAPHPLDPHLGPCILKNKFSLSYLP